MCRVATLLSFLLCVLPAVTVSAQQPTLVEGRVCTLAEDSVTIVALPYASVTVLERKDSTLVKGMVSDDDGRFSLTFLPAPRTDYLLKLSYTGMTPLYRRLNASEPDIRLGNLLLRDGLQLAEVVVSAPAKEIEMVGDTTVIYADAYNPPAGSALEELVKRIPGLEYDPQTKALTYNGLTITEINVNGEPFFAGNHALALENLPAELVSKIKVYDKRSKREQFTGVKTGGENYVLDLQTREKFNGTFIASAAAGAGNHRKKDAELIGNYFKKGGENLSLIARTGNRNMTTSYRGNRQDNLATNFMKKIGKNLSVSGNVMYSRSLSGNEGTSYYEQYLTTGNTYQYSSSGSESDSRTLNATLGIQWQADEKTLVDANGSIGRSKSENTGLSRQATYDAPPGLSATDPFGDGWSDVAADIRVNDISRQSASTSRSDRQYLEMGIIRLIGDKGGSIGFNARYAGDGSEGESLSEAATTYYQLQAALGGDSVLLRRQRQYSPTRSREGGAELMFIRPLNRHLYLQLSYKFARTRRSSDRDTYERSVLVDSLSNRTRSLTDAHDIGLQMSYTDERWEVTGGLTVRPERQRLHQKTGLNLADTLRRSVSSQPTLTVAWRKQAFRLQLSYQGDTRQPDLSDLLTLTDNSDPLNITHGNPRLRASYSQRARFEVRATKQGLSADAMWGNQLNSIAQAVVYHMQTGARETYPVNINGNWNTSATVRYQKRIKRRFTLSARTGYSFVQSVSLVNDGDSEQPDRSTTHNTSLDALLRLGYQPRWGGVDLTGDWRFHHSTNLLRQTDSYTRRYSFALGVHANLPAGILLRSDAAHTFRNGTGITRGADDQTVWNLQLSWRFLKRKQAELSAYWADILSQKKNYSRNVTSGGLSESHTRQIGSYFLISFKYRFNKQL